VPPSGGHTAPCWWTIVTTGWVVRYKEAVQSLGIEAFVSEPPDLTDGPDGTAHLVKGAGLADAVVSGTVIRAWCGRRFVSSHDHHGLPMCAECARLFLTWERLVEEAATPDG
jgi:hypothetical protein